MEATRGRILEAACELLASGGFAAFTIDTVARAADVSRMTVYNQFGPKGGLLEAIFDWVAERGNVQRLGDAAAHSDPEQGLAEFVHGCCGLWASHRGVQRRLVGLAAIDSDIEAALQGRETRRSGPIGTLLTRLSERDGTPAADLLDTAIRRVIAITSFASVDALAGTQDPAQIGQLVLTLARCAIDDLA